MIKHWFKIIWNRKKQNSLLILEIFVAFLVICALSIQATKMWINYQEPLGFNYENIWTISFDNKDESRKWQKHDNEARFQKLLQTIQAQEEVASVAGADILPFTYNNWTNSDSIPGESVHINRTSTTDDFLRVMQMELTQGEWFNPSHDALSYTPVVINERLAKKLYAGENPIGKRIMPSREENIRERYQKLMSEGKIREERVVGVIKNYKKYGKLDDPVYMAFRRTSPSDTLMSDIPFNLVVKMKDASGMSGAFEEKVLKLLTSLEPNWSFVIKPLTEYRDMRFRRTITPLIAFAVIAGFLIIMVALGLIGVLWQNITARRPEIGLRRALGAAQGNIFQQIIGELSVLTTLGVLAGSFIVWQLPLFEVLPVREIPILTYGIGWLIATVFIYLLTIACGLYPSMMATTVSPTEALHDE